MTWTYNVITLQGILDFFIVKSNNFNNKIDRDVGADRSKATDKMVCQQTSKGESTFVTDNQCDTFSVCFFVDPFRVHTQSDHSSSS